jgi:hypothetical protein
MDFDKLERVRHINEALHLSCYYMADKVIQHRRPQAILSHIYPYPPIRSALARGDHDRARTPASPTGFPAEVSIRPCHPIKHRLGYADTRLSYAVHPL